MGKNAPVAPNVVRGNSTIIVKLKQHNPLRTTAAVLSMEECPYIVSLNTLAVIFVSRTCIVIRHGLGGKILFNFFCVLRKHELNCNGRIRMRW